MNRADSATSGPPVPFCVRPLQLQSESRPGAIGLNDPAARDRRSVEQLALDADQSLLATYRLAAPTPVGALSRYDAMHVAMVTITPGVPRARALAGDGNYVYFAVDPSGLGAHDGMVQRMLR